MMTLPAGPATSAPPAATGGAALSPRLEALARFVRAAGPYLPGQLLAPSRDVLERATQRLMLSHQHTVVALAGTTGSGKSSLFNAIAGRHLSPVGVRRPTTGEAYACLWGPEGDAADLLDWLKIPPSHRSSLELSGDQAGLRGLVLLDLPDCDSVERDHAAEVRRLLELVDAVVWVVDPQKYADHVIHTEHLPRFRCHREVALVALNQADLLSAADLERLLADLRRLLTPTGLPAIATSAVDAPAGLAQLRAWLERLVADRRAALRRLAGDVDLAAEGLTSLVGPPVADDVLERTALPELTEGLARVAGVTAATEVVETSYRRRAADATGWPPLRWLRRLRPQPLRRLPTRATASGDRPALLTEGMSQRAAASLLARAVATQVAAGLPPPWPDAVIAAARSRLGDLTRDLDRVAATAAPNPTRTPVWWQVVAVAQWLAIGVALIGLAWLAFTGLLAALGLPGDGGVPAPVLLVAAGLLAGVVVTGVTIPVVGAAARRAGAQATGQLREQVARVGRERVLQPVGVVLSAYREARVAYHTARGEA